MQFRMTKTPLLALAAGLLLTTSVAAAPVYGTAATLTGSRTESGGGLTTGGAYAADTIDQGIAWTISGGPGAWTYSYTLTGFDGAPGAGAGLSHWILDLTDDCYRPGDPACVTQLDGPVESSEIGDYGPGNPSNPGMPAQIIGIKFNVSDGGDATYTFVSSRSPVWGDVYFKGGREHFAYNPGIVDHLSELPGDFIARPDGGGDDETVPEPGTLMLLGAALVAGAGRIRRRR